MPRTIALIALAALPAAAAHAQVTAGQIDTFQNGTTQGWQVGSLSHPAPPANVPTGGPAGAGDAYLSLTSTGGAGPGRALVVYNRAQWAGNYTAAGITNVSLNVRNFSQIDAVLRFELGNGANQAMTTPILVPANSGWQPISFSVAPGSLTATAGTVAAALSSATELRLMHNPDGVSPPPSVVLNLGVDNIRAIPAPGVLALAGTGLVFAARRRRR